MKRLFYIQFLLFLFVSISIDSLAQDSPENNSAYNLSDLTHLGGTRIYSVNSTNVVGTPLLYQDFKKGRFQFSSNNQSEVVPINYDLEQNLVLYKKENQIMVLENENITGFTIEDSQGSDSSQNVNEVYKLNITKNIFSSDERGPVQVLYDQNGAIQLFALHKVKYVRGNRQDPFSGIITDRYKNDTLYLLTTPDGQTHQFRKLRSKDIVKAIGNDSKKELNNYMNRYDLDKRSQNDLVKFLSYYDSMVTDTMKDH